MKMSREQMFRRAVHLLTPVFLVYYWVPDPVWPEGPAKGAGLIFLLMMVFLFETIRRISGLNVVGLRNYERMRMAAYAWAALGLTFVFLTMPFEVAVPAVIGMAWVDPLIGELRTRKSELYPGVPIAVYFSLTLIALTLLLGLNVWTFIAAAASAPAAVWVEKQRFWKLDDDMTMMVMPAVLIWVILTLTQVL
ncbi:MAG: hypothetical protein WC375_08285 [Methanomassiliicoccales archaeon]|jgi:hypothetical protein